MHARTGRSRTADAGALVAAAVLALVASGCAIARVSVSSTGARGHARPRRRILGVTDDGRYSLFLSDADNLVPGDTNGHAGRLPPRHDDRATTVRANVAGNGAQLARGSYDGGA